MLSDTLQARLERLNRQSLGKAKVRTARHVKPKPAPKRRAILPGEAVETPAGALWINRRPLAELCGSIAGIVAAAAGTDKAGGSLGVTDSGAPPPHPEAVALAESFPRDTLFLDLETCGFAGSMVFLIGLVRWADGQLVLEQLLARDYTQERAILQSLWQSAADARLLVTFNGKSFDWPMVHDRSTYHRLGRDLRVDKKRRSKEEDASTSSPISTPREPLPESGLGPRDTRPELAHADLLHHSRRKWRDHLPNCRLQTLEWYICGRRRAGDIPGSQIPATYHKFVRDGDPTRMRDVLHHNALDLLTLVQLGHVLTQPNDTKLKAVA